MLLKLFLKKKREHQRDNKNKRERERANIVYYSSFFIGTVH